MRRNGLIGLGVAPAAGGGKANDWPIGSRTDKDSGFRTTERATGDGALS